MVKEGWSRDVCLSMSKRVWQERMEESHEEHNRGPERKQKWWDNAECLLSWCVFEKEEERRWAEHGGKGIL